VKLEMADSRKRLLFFCPSLAPGHSGVGDYTRRLAAECLRQGVEARMVSLCDTSAQEVALEEEQAAGDASVHCLRLPEAWSWVQRLEAVRNWLQEWRPEWTSLQFVPFGYQPKGLPWQLGAMLARLPGTPRWQMMFHELWVGAFAGAPWKLRLLGMAQRQLIRRLLCQLKPARVHTQARPHQQLLHLLGMQAANLPLFGNIRIQPDGAEEGRRLIFSDLQEADPGPGDGSAWHIGGLFGVIHPEWRPEPFFKPWLQAAEKSGRQPLLVLIGRSGRSTEHLQALLQPYLPRLQVRRLGPLPDPVVSQVLQALDFGLATTPWQLREKSGSLAALRDHGLPIVLTRDDWRPRGVSADPEAPEADPGCFLAQADRPIPFQKLKRRPPADTLPQVAARFLADLQGACKS
jgi:hypothetical protein